MKKTILIFLLLLIGCKEKKQEEDELGIVFNDLETITINSEPILLKNPELFFINIQRMIFSEGLLLISDPNSEYSMKIVDLKTKYGRKFGKRGRGPDEIKSNSNTFSLDYKKKELYVNDNFSYFIYSIDSLSNGNDSPQRTLNIEINEGHFMQTTYCNEQYIFGGMLQKRFGLYNILEKKFIDKYEYEVGALVNQASFYNNPNISKVAFFQLKHAALGIIDIKENDFNMVEKIWWSNKDKPVHSGNEWSTIPDPNPRIGFTDATVSKDYIYALYSGNYIKKSTSILDSYLSDTIYVFDWEGNPIKQYKLDNKVSSIAIDEKNNILYTASYKEGEQYLAKFNLK